jgi:hypothetical protein
MGVHAAGLGSFERLSPELDYIHTLAISSEPLHAEVLLLDRLRDHNLTRLKEVVRPGGDQGLGLVTRQPTPELSQADHSFVLALVPSGVDYVQP